MNSSAKTARSRSSSPSCQWRKRRSIIFCFHHLHLLPRCYQDRTNQPPLPPQRGVADWWFLVGLGCLRSDSRNFLVCKLANRRSVRGLGVLVYVFHPLRIVFPLLPRYYQEFWPFSCQLEWGRAGPPAMPTPVDPAKMPSEYRPWRPGSASLAQSLLCCVH